LDKLIEKQTEEVSAKISLLSQKNDEGADGIPFRRMFYNFAICEVKTESLFSQKLRKNS